jgi:Ulp1 family protease
MDAMASYLKAEWKLKHPIEQWEQCPDFSQWEKVPTTDDTPKQNNLVDCGIYCLIYADLLSVGLPLNFTADEIDLCRERIALSILKGSAI